MATVKERTAPKRARRKKAGDAALQAAAGDATKNDPNQPPLPGMEEGRIPAIERSIKLVLDTRTAAREAREAADRELQKLPSLLHKHALQSYRCLGCMVVIEPGAEIVKIKKVKDK